MTAQQTKALDTLSKVESTLTRAAAIRHRECDCVQQAEQILMELCVDCISDGDLHVVEILMQHIRSWHRAHDSRDYFIRFSFANLKRLQARFNE